MKIGTREIGPAHPPYIIAELGVNHDGSVERALQLVGAAADAGADAVKLQLFTADLLMSKAARLAAYQKAAGESDPVEMLRRLELSIDQMASIVERAHARNIHAIVTVFSVELVEQAERLPWDAYKTASPDIIHKPLLEALMATGKPLIVSTGASTMEEVERAIEWLTPARERLAILQCVSCYPTPEPHAELGGIQALSRAFNVPVGYSDHTRDNGTGGHAVAWGATILEKHVTYDRRAAGPDHAASLTQPMLRKYVEFSRFAHGAWESRDELRCPERIAAVEAAIAARPPGSSPDPQAVAFMVKAKMLAPRHGGDLVKRVLDIERDVRTVSRQSITTTRPLPAGHHLTRGDLTFKRPGAGIPPFRLDEILNRPLAHAVDADMPVMEADITPA